jgi:SAM-dependent methyltransferase
MDKITLAVKNMYEKYPYPSGSPMMRTGTDVNLLLSYVNNCRENTGSIHVLDAGCGRGVGLIGAAMLQPDVHFIGADINTTAINEARLNAKNRGLTNIHFVEADLMTLEGVEVPLGGFDVIYSSGVIHHLSKPLTGLSNLEKVLAPHGVISLMVYGSYGRQALYRLIDGIDLMFPDENEIEERLPLARLLTQAANQTIFKGNYWENTSATDDIEFIDRCLNVNEVSYDINSLWQLIDDAKMKFIRWDDPEEWSINRLFDNVVLKNKLNQLDNKEQYKIIERTFERPRLELIISKSTNSPRPSAPVDAIEEVNFSVSPEVSFSIEKRNLNGFQRIETLKFRIKTKEPQQIPNGLLAQAALMLVDQNTLFSGNDMINALIEKGATKIESIAVLLKLVSLNIIYCPH